MIIFDNRPFAELILGNEGSYIPPEAREKLFTKFYTSGKKFGNGLGLTICHEIVLSHGGKIICQSDLNNGTEFIFTLPLLDKNMSQVE